MDLWNSYVVVIEASLIIIISYIFNIISKRTNIPSVLLLILLGVGINLAMQRMGAAFESMFAVLELLGIVGLIMIVLEAALDLKLTREKWPIIWKSFSVALIALLGSALVCAGIIHFFMISDLFVCLVYAVPLSILSSAIIIPSVIGLAPEKREFMVYEGTFSDILGIMFFYFLVGNAQVESTQLILTDIFTNIFVTVVLSVAVSYGLVLIFQKLTTQVKLFLLIAVLLLLYSIGKLFHLSSLIMILIFGLVINNHEVFFRGQLRKWLDAKAIESTYHNFHLITMESAFVVRTFFFVIFGMTISLESLFDLEVGIISCLIVVGLYLIRYLVLKVFLKKDIYPQLYIAPRGLITILLFFAIPTQFQSDRFNSGILLFVIIITSVLMTISLMADKKKRSANEKGEQKPPAPEAPQEELAE